MPGFTNKFYYEILGGFFAGRPLPASFFLALVTDDMEPGPDTNTLSELTEIQRGNGYNTGGIAIARNTVSFPTLSEDDLNDKGIATLKDLKITASGGSLPKTGKGARYAVLTGPGATVANRKVYLSVDLGSPRSVSDGQELRMNGLSAELSNQL